ncbi:MAG: DUF2124 family protein [Halobacteriota archaeon]|nr:DUF2124 family protein [Halobacteriota archaeon]
MPEGVYFRVGGFRSESHEELRNIDQGTITLTKLNLLLPWMIEHNKEPFSGLIPMYLIEGLTKTMERNMSYRGLNGLIKAFMESIEGIKEGSKIAFVGSVGICSPFAQLLSYAMRDRGYKIIFIPKAIAKDAREMKMIEGVGYQIMENFADAFNCDVIVILGGLAIPKYKTTAEDVEGLIKEISNDARIIGFSFGGVFVENGWTDVIDFDITIDSVIYPIEVSFRDDIPTLD